MLFRAHKTATCSKESGARGAKQLVVDSTQTTLAGPSCCIWLSNAATSVLSSSPTRFGSITIGVSPGNSATFINFYLRQISPTVPAVMMHLKHAFWSIRDHNTYLACSLSCFKANIHNTRLIPVAIGTTKHPAEVLTPERKEDNQRH